MSGVGDREADRRSRLGSDEPPQYDRRKQFDTTTPTLIDEDDEDTEMLQLQQRLRSALGDSAAPWVRRTPGAAARREELGREEPGTTPSQLTAVGPTEAAPHVSWDTLRRETGGTPETRGLFASFESWGAASKDLDTPAGRTNTGTFSPNILRLTEAIGNLLQEDEDDAYALEIPNAFRPPGGQQPSALNTSQQGMSDFDDWTGAYVFESDRRKHPTFSTRSAVGAVKSSRQRSTGEFRNPYALLSETDAAHTHEPKPRRNEALEFTKPQSRTTPIDDRESPQLLIFGGAFAPPGSSGGGFMRPVASLQGADSNSARVPSRSETISPFVPAGPPDRTRVAAMPGMADPYPEHQPPPGRPGAATVSHMPGASQREHSLSYDSYHSMIPPVPMEGPYIPGVSYRTSTSPAYYAPTPSYAATQPSEMQATAPVFVPHRTMTSTPTYPTAAGPIPRPSQWPAPPGFAAVAAEYDVEHHGSWPSSSYNPLGHSGFGYAPPQQSYPPSQGDPRMGLSPSPHAASWQPYHPANSDPPAAYRTVPPQQYRPDSAASTVGMTSPSPHPSIAGSEHSGRGGGKRDNRRKQRSRKKSQKTEPGGKSSAVELKKKSESSRPGSVTHSVEDEARVTPVEDPMDARRMDLVESPATRVAFKEFYRTFRGEERLSFQKAEAFALKVLQDESLPEAVHWRVYLELADLAKRSNRYVEARCLYQKVCELQPYASQGWLEYSKLEEECGHMNRVMNILHQGLHYCELSENLLTRAVKHHEKMGNLDSARGLLAKLKHVGIEKVWRTVLEGALLEARAGNVSTARRVLKYLMHHVPWYGPLYLEAYRLEKDQGNIEDALLVVERGLHTIPRYGPLWFGAFRLCEELDLSQHLYHLPNTISMIDRAASHISKELVWKVHLDAAQMLERSAFEQGAADAPSLLEPARHRLVMTILTSPNNLRWKVWLAAGRMELELGNTDRARSLFVRAHEVVPGKGRSSTLLECARLEDFVGDTVLARALLCKGRALYGNDWKVWLESILLEMRVGNHRRAVEMCEIALEMHQGTGRLWATLVQLRHFFGRDEAQLVALRRALNAVPKSGEVWCEGGRIHLNPFSDTFDLDRARRHLYFATRFTPQYGDGFVETIRLELLRQWIVPIASLVWNKTKHGFQAQLSGAFEDGLTKYVTDVSLAISVAARPDISGVPKLQLPNLLYHEIVNDVAMRLDSDFRNSVVDLKDVYLACVNADPNYGLLWFHCRRKANDSPRRIIEDTTGIVVEELRAYSHLYLAAMVRREAILSTMEIEKPACLMSNDIEVNDSNATEWEDYADAKLRAAPSLETIFNPTDPTTGLNLLESTARGPLFATGLSKLNKRQSIASMSLSERRRALFGIDALFP
jgi:tetratricopeptide (TPR) repeat protein